MKVFISHSQQEKDRARYERLCNALDVIKVDHWDPKSEIEIGSPIRKQLRKAVQACSVCVYLATKSSLVSSWCHAEVGAFWGAGKLTIVYFDDPDATEKDLPPELQDTSWTRDLTRVINALKKEKSPVRRITRWGRNNRFFAATILSTILLTISVIYMMEPFISAGIRYDFENDEMGWIAQDTPGNHAFRYTFHATERSKTGSYSLGANIKLVGGDAELDQGEIYVNILQSPPRGAKAPLDLSNNQVHLWVNIPEDVVVGDKIGGIQLFLKDSMWKSLYGRYVTLSPKAKINDWFVLTLLPAKEPLQPGSHRDVGFNPKEIIVIGLRIDACGEMNCIYEGDIFVDSVYW